MKTFSADYLRKFITDFFTACGSTPEDAFLVADNLVESNLMGYDRFCAYQMTSRPAKGFQEVVLPGTYDFRTREKRLAEGIPMDEGIWAQIVAAAAEMGVKAL